MCRARVPHVQATHFPRASCVLSEDRYWWKSDVRISLPTAIATSDRGRSFTLETCFLIGPDIVRHVYTDIAIEPPQQAENDLELMQTQRCLEINLSARRKFNHLRSWSEFAPRSKQNVSPERLSCLNKRSVAIVGGMTQCCRGKKVHKELPLGGAIGAT